MLIETIWSEPIQKEHAEQTVVPERAIVAEARESRQAPAVQGRAGCNECAARRAATAAEPRCGANRGRGTAKRWKSPFGEAEHRRTASRIAARPRLSPRQLDRRLVELGYRGQPAARRAAALLAYQHLARLRAVFCEGVDPASLPPQNHYIFAGPSGSGKTFLVELLFRDVLRVPTVIVDATQYTETGYVGEDVSTILTRLLLAAGQDLAWAACGVVCIDELDKLGGPASTTRDISGRGVQRGLLTLLSSSSAEFPETLKAPGSRDRRIVIPLSTITFIGAGAFSSLDESAPKEPAIGFRKTGEERRSAGVFATLANDPLKLREALVTAGLMPELVGRFSRVVALEPLGTEALRTILTDNLLPLYQQSFEREGVTLEFDASYIDELAKDAFRLKTGARGLRAALGTALEAAAYEYFGEPSRGYRVRLGWDGNETIIHTSAPGQSISCPSECRLLPRDEELQGLIDEIMSNAL